MKPLFIVFEGGEGTGKSTQAEHLASYFGAVLTREPGGTAFGQQLRELLLDPSQDIDPKAETLLMAAARAQHVSQVILPALRDNKHVVCDRFVHSSIAYQGVARGMGVDEVVRINEWATGGLWPDLVILLDVSDDETVGRRNARGGGDRFEAEHENFHLRVNQTFRDLAEADQKSAWRIVDGVGTTEEVASRVRATVSEWIVDTKL